MTGPPTGPMQPLPSLPAFLLRLVLPHEYRDEILGDAREAYDNDVRERGEAFARNQLWREVLSFRPLQLRWEARGLRTRSRTAASARNKPMQSIFGDIRYALRVLTKARGYTAVAVITIALGVGANTAIFSVIDGVLLRPLPYFEPERIVRVWQEQTLTKSLLDRFEEQTRSFSGLSGTATETFSFTGDGEPEELIGGIV